MVHKEKKFCVCKFFISNQFEVDLVQFLILSILLTSSFESGVGIGDSTRASSPNLVHFYMKVVNSATYSFKSSFLD